MARPETGTITLRLIDEASNFLRIVYCCDSVTAFMQKGDDMAVTYQ